MLKGVLHVWPRAHDSPKVAEKQYIYTSIIIIEPQHEISNNVVCAYAQSDQSLCLSLEYSMTVKLLAEHHLQFQSLKGGYTGSSESTLVK